MSENDRRGVFVSWSQPAAAEIARHLKPFLEDVLGTAAIFMSQAMEAGARWSMEIPQWLETCDAGLVIVTRENSHEPWLHFEAGALSKQIDGSRVVPLLCGASVGDIQGTPLSLFQAVVLDHDNFLAVCLAFGNAFGISEDTVRRRFEKSWPDLESEVSKARVAEGPKKQLAMADLMAVLERVASQVTAIESTLRPSGALQPYASTIGGSINYPRTLADLVDDDERRRKNQERAKAIIDKYNEERAKAAAAKKNKRPPPPEKKS